MSALNLNYLIYVYNALNIGNVVSPTSLQFFSSYSSNTLCHYVGKMFIVIVLIHFGKSAEENILSILLNEFSIYVLVLGKQLF